MAESRDDTGGWRWPHRFVISVQQPPDNGWIHGAGFKLGDWNPFAEHVGVVQHGEGLVGQFGGGVHAEMESNLVLAPVRRAKDVLHETQEPHSSRQGSGFLLLFPLGAAPHVLVGGGCTAGQRPEAKALFGVGQELAVPQAHDHQPHAELQAAQGQRISVRARPRPLHARWGPRPDATARAGRERDHPGPPPPVARPHLHRC